MTPLPDDGIKRCSCPDGWPRVFYHDEADNLIAAVSHHLLACALSSVLVSGYRRSLEEFEQRIEEALGPGRRP